MTKSKASQGKKRITQNPGHIRNKVKRAQVMVEYRKQKKTAKKEAQAARQREREENGEEAAPKQIPKTLESTRETDATTVLPDDEEVIGDTNDDEFSSIFQNETQPRLLITTRPKPSGKLYHFIHDLLSMIPNSAYYKRGSYEIKDICRYATNRSFSHVIVLSEKHAACNGAVITKLPAGPTAYFKVSSVKLSDKIAGCGNTTSHHPEIILNNFTTRLGHRIGRFLGSLFPHAPNFKGRQVATFHNQRDCIFVRHHRYVFDSLEKARLQELGPRFTLRLRWLQEGTFDTKFGEYEWIHKRKEMDTSRRRFHL